MLIVLSPAKTLDETPSTLAASTEPRMTDETAVLARQMRRYSARSLSKLMGVSDAIAELNVQRYQTFFDDEGATKQALHLFKGDSYLELDLDSFAEDDYAFAQQHLRILSGLYGVLRPLDAIKPYRLEMGTRLKTRRGASLYGFWGDRLARAISDDLDAQGDRVIINLASTEYFKAIQGIDAQVVDIRFEDWINGKYKVASFFAKRARGAMAGDLIRRRAGSLEDVVAFSWGGYAYDESASSPDTLTFRRGKA